MRAASGRTLYTKHIFYSINRPDLAHHNRETAMSTTHHDEELISSLRFLTHRHQHLRILSKGLLLAALLLLGTGGWFLLVNPLDWTLTMQLGTTAAGVGGMLLLVILAYQLTATADLYERESKYAELQIDVYHAVQDALHEVLATHVPGYQKARTDLNVGEELLRTVTAHTERRVRFRSALEQKLGDIPLAKAVDNFVAESLHRRDVAADRDRIEATVRDLADSHVLQFPET